MESARREAPVAHVSKQHKCIASKFGFPRAGTQEAALQLPHWNRGCGKSKHFVTVSKIFGHKNDKEDPCMKIVMKP